MNVLVVFTFNYSLETWKNSGTLNREVSIYKKLHEKNNVNFVFLTYGDGSDQKFDLSSYGIKVIPIYTYVKKSNYKFLNYIKSFFIPIKLLKLLKKQNIDIIKQNQLLGSWVAILIKLLLKKPLFTRTGYDMYTFSKNMGKSIYIQFLYKSLTSLTLRFSDLYTVSSKSDLKLFKRSKKKVLYRPNWILPINTPVNIKKINKFISIGRLEMQKNYEKTIEFISETNFEIDIVGDGSLSLKLANLADSKNVKMQILNQLENDELLSLLAKYKFYISNSNFEGHPKSLLEAMSVGCVVFASNISNHIELIDHGKNGFLIDNNSKKSFEDLLENINNWDLESISKNAVSFVNKNFSLEKASDEEFLDYNSIIF